MTRHQLHTWQQIGQVLKIRFPIEDWLGPVSGVLSCTTCGQDAFFHLAGWSGDDLSSRILAVRELPSGVLKTYLANVDRDYCDLARKQAETESLISVSAQDATLVLLAIPDMQVMAVSATPCNPPLAHWQLLQSSDYDRWFEFIRTHGATQKTVG